MANKPDIRQLIEAKLIASKEAMPAGLRFGSPNFTEDSELQDQMMRLLKESARTNSADPIREYRNQVHQVRQSMPHDSPFRQSASSEEHRAKSMANIVDQLISSLSGVGASTKDLEQMFEKLSSTGGKAIRQLELSADKITAEIGSGRMTPEQGKQAFQQQVSLAQARELLKKGDYEGFSKAVRKDGLAGTLADAGWRGSDEQKKYDEWRREKIMGVVQPYVKTGLDAGQSVLHGMSRTGGDPLAMIGQNAIEKAMGTFWNVFGATNANAGGAAAALNAGLGFGGGAATGAAGTAAAGGAAKAVSTSAGRQAIGRLIASQGLRVLGATAGLAFTTQAGESGDPTYNAYAPYFNNPGAAFGEGRDDGADIFMLEERMRAEQNPEIRSGYAQDLAQTLRRADPKPEYLEQFGAANIDELVSGISEVGAAPSFEYSIEAIDAMGETSNDVSNSLGEASTSIKAFGALIGMGGVAGLISGVLSGGKPITSLLSGGASAGAAAIDFMSTVYSQGIQQGTPIYENMYRGATTMSSSYFNENFGSIGADGGLADSLINNPLSSYGYTPSQIIQAYGAVQRGPTEGRDIEAIVQESGIAARTLGVDINDMIGSTSMMARAGGSGSVGSFMGLTRELGGGDDAFAKSITDAFVSAARTINLTSGGGAGFNQVMGTLGMTQGGLTNSSDASLAQLAAENPELAIQANQSINSFIKSGMSGNNMSLALGIRSGLNIEDIAQGALSPDQMRSFLMTTMQSTGLGNMMSDGEFTQGGRNNASILATQMGVPPNVLISLLEGVANGTLSDDGIQSALDDLSAPDAGGASRDGTIEALMLQRTQSEANLVKAIDESIDEVLEYNRVLGGLTLSTIAMGDAVVNFLSGFAEELGVELSEDKRYPSSEDVRNRVSSGSSGRGGGEFTAGGSTFRIEIIELESGSTPDTETD